MAIDINKMKAKMAAAQNNGKGGKSDFWKLTEGEHTVRILPSEDGTRRRKSWSASMGIQQNCLPRASWSCFEP